MGDTLTGTAKLKHDIKSDIDDRGVWEQYDKTIREMRMGYRRETSQQYPEGPNYVEMIIDDVVTGKTDQEIAMYWNAPRMAYVASMVPLDDKFRLAMEIGFDAYVRYIIKPRAKFELAMDTKNLRGFAVLKQTRTYSHLLKQMVPDFIVIDNLDLVVPAFTTTVESATRLCHIIKKTKGEYKRWVKDKTASGIELDMELVNKILNSGNKNREEDVKEQSNEIAGITTSVNSEWIVLWEVCNIAEEDKPEINVTEGERVITMISPDYPDEPLFEVAWRNPDGSPRKWPYVQPRYECRSDLWYDARGGGHLCMDDQIEATSVRNARDTFLDYFARPMFENESGENTNNITFSPGSQLPRGVKPAMMPQAPPQFDFLINNNRQTCGRRLGVSAVYNFSGNMSESRKTQKTLGEVQIDEGRSSSMSATSVDRFNEPISDIFQLIWEDLARMRLQFPILIPGKSVEYIDPSAYDGQVLMIPAASAKNLNPEVQLGKSVMLADWVMKYADRLPVSLMAIVQTVFGYYDSRLTNGWLVGEDDQATIDMQIQQLQEQIMMLAEGGKDLSGREENIEKTLEQVISTLETNGVKV